MRFTSFVVASVVCVANSTARADFVGGIEQFNGSALDTNTWSSYIYPGASIAQNNAMTITSQQGHPADYVTRRVRVGVGGFVQADLVYLTGDSELALYLTNNSTNTADTLSFDTKRFALEFFGTTGKISALTNIGLPGNSVYLQPDIATVSQVTDTKYNFRIERPTAGTAKFDVRNSANTLVGSQTLDLGQTMPDYMNIALYAYSATGMFDNVTIGGNAEVPEPMGLSIVVISSRLLARRRS